VALLSDETFAALTLLAGGGQGKTTAGASAALLTGKTGAGFVVVDNGSDSDDAYLTVDGSTADANAFPLKAGKSISFGINDATKVKCYSGGSPVLGWLFFKRAS